MLESLGLRAELRGTSEGIRIVEATSVYHRIASQQRPRENYSNVDHDKRHTEVQWKQIFWLPLKHMEVPRHLPPHEMIRQMELLSGKINS